jgi:hypothetical protein
MIARIDESTKRLITERINSFRTARYGYNSYFQSQTVSDLVDRAVQCKRNGDLLSANALYLRTVHEDGLDSAVIWGWVKVLLLAKNFADAQLLLHYNHAMLVRWYQLEEYHPGNKLEDYKENIDILMPLRTVGSTGTTPPINLNAANSFSFYDLLSTFTFKPFSYLTAKAKIYLYDKNAVEQKIASFGGSDYWNNYYLTNDEFNSFLSYFGNDA